MVLDDDEIEGSRIEDQRGRPSKAKRDAAENRKRQKAFSKKALQAVKASDARVFAEQLRLANVTEDSEEWKRAWKYFRANCG
jgi:hypothetical protein